MTYYIPTRENQALLRSWLAPCKEMLKEAYQPHIQKVADTISEMLRLKISCEVSEKKLKQIENDFKLLGFDLSELTFANYYSDHRLSEETDPEIFHAIENADYEQVKNELNKLTAEKKEAKKLTCQVFEFKFYKRSQFNLLEHSLMTLKQSYLKIEVEKNEFQWLLDEAVKNYENLKNECVGIKIEINGLKKLITDKTARISKLEPTSSIYKRGEALLATMKEDLKLKEEKSEALQKAPQNISDLNIKIGECDSRKKAAADVYFKIASLLMHVYKISPLLNGGKALDILSFSDYMDNFRKYLLEFTFEMPYFYSSDADKSTMLKYSASSGLNEFVGKLIRKINYNEAFAKQVYELYAIAYKNPKTKIVDIFNQHAPTMNAISGHAKAVLTEDIQKLKIKITKLENGITAYNEQLEKHPNEKVSIERNTNLINKQLDTANKELVKMNEQMARFPADELQENLDVQPKGIHIKFGSRSIEKAEASNDQISPVSERNKVSKSSNSL